MVQCDLEGKFIEFYLRNFKHFLNGNQTFHWSLPIVIVSTHESVHVIVVNGPKLLYLEISWLNWIFHWNKRNTREKKYRKTTSKTINFRFLITAHNHIDLSNLLNHILCYWSFGFSLHFFALHQLLFFFFLSFDMHAFSISTVHFSEQNSIRPST